MSEKTKLINMIVQALRGLSKEELEEILDFITGETSKPSEALEETEPEESIDEGD